MATMFALEEDMSFYIYNEFVDMRCGLPRLYDLISAHMSDIPILTGKNVFIFFSRSRYIVKIVKYDSGGLLMYQKRLEKGTFEFPKYDGTTKSFAITFETLSFIMRGISLKSIKQRKRFSADVQ